MIEKKIREIAPECEISYLPGLIVVKDSDKVLHEVRQMLDNNEYICDNGTFITPPVPKQYGSIFVYNNELDMDNKGYLILPEAEEVA